MMPLLLAGLALGGLMIAGKVGESSGEMEILQDIDPLEQGGNFSVTYDDALKGASDKVGVPFAILKAHAIRESSLNHTAYLLEPSGKASYGLMQVLWWKGSNRFKQWGYDDDRIGDGTLLYQADVNAELGARIWLDNWKRFKNLRDSINAYNTGVRESVRIAPVHYVDDVLKYYNQILGRVS